ncbi:MAG: hypothetical protein A2X94_10995 [Bdellovibrionales bacterium GWB1_55_8]|nr:MAG: hypothetical protein A2X94_10995 [Bdellovibrionales bacterium GWB1_55_8]
MVNPTGGFYVDAIVADGVDYYFHEQSAFENNPCKVIQGETVAAKTDIFCILDVAELDLYYNKFGLNYNAPPGMCKYTELVGYSYYAYEPSPPGLDVTISATYLDGSLTAASSDNAAVSLDVSTNALTCTYDYTSDSGPNCCEGLVTIDSTYTFSPVTGDHDDDPATPDTTVIPAPVSQPGASTSLGGKRSACLNGPGTLDIFPKDAKSGYPRDLLTKAEVEGVNGLFEIPSSIEKDMASTVYVANYFNPTSFGGVGSTFPQAAGVKPTALLKPFYQFGCLNSAWEYVARIRLLVRSWDRVDNFTAQSNPYSAGNEGQFDTALHDRSVWEDFLNTYPGDNQ